MKMVGFPVPAHEVRHEIRVANSRFIATLAPVATVEEARTFISRIRAEFTDASHNVPVYLIGHGGAVTAHSSDDGEPSGTAGRPSLAVLQGSGLGDVAVVVTRYFGGTKLGTGGLVRAYGDAVRAVLEATPRAHKVATDVVRLTVPYPLLERFRRLIPDHNGQILDEIFAADVTMTVRLLSDAREGLATAVQELSNGQVAVEVVREGEVVRMERQVGN